MSTSLTKMKKKNMYILNFLPLLHYNQLPKPLNLLSKIYLFLLLGILCIIKPFAVIEAISSALDDI